MSKLIYVTDDDLHIRQLILSFLRKDGFEAVGFERGEEMMTAFAGRVPDLVVLDIMLPGMDGLGICTLIRQQYAIPIMLVSAKDSELDRITGITLGGDDYMVKPFSPIEMVVRVKALLRRTEMNYQSEAEQKLLTFGNLTIDTRRHAVTIGADV
ncbi:MAG: response regulator transcription factor, partial [Clostridia bacterium]